EGFAPDNGRTSMSRNADALPSPVGDRRDLVETGRAEALAVSFLWSYRYPAHETRAAELLRAAYPGIPVTVGSELAPVGDSSAYRVRDMAIEKRQSRPGGSCDAARAIPPLS